MPPPNIDTERSQNLSDLPTAAVVELLRTGPRPADAPPEPGVRSWYPDPARALTELLNRGYSKAEINDLLNAPVR